MTGNRNAKLIYWEAHKPKHACDHSFPPVCQPSAPHMRKCSHCFSCLSQLCWVHTFLLLPGHWVTTGKSKFSTVVLLPSLSFAAFFALQGILFISHPSSPLQNRTLHKVLLVSLLSVLHLFRLVGWQTWNWRYHGMCIHFFPLPHLVTFLLCAASCFLI